MNMYGILQRRIHERLHVTGGMKTVVFASRLL